MRHIHILVFLLVVLSPIQAQESINASGGDGSGNDGTICYSVGQLFYQSQTGTDGTVATGVQQAYIIEDISTKFQNPVKMDLRVAVYPNPATDYLYISIKNLDDFQTGQLRYTLYSMNGHALEESSLSDMVSKVNMQTYKAGVYFLKVRNGKYDLKAFKIIKN